MDFLFLSIFNQKQLGNNIEPSIRASSHTNTHTPKLFQGETTSNRNYVWLHTHREKKGFIKKSSFHILRLFQFTII